MKLKHTRMSSNGRKIYAFRKFLNPLGIGGEVRITWEVEEKCRYSNSINISDCGTTIGLDFPHHNKRNRNRSLKKIDLMIDALEEFRTVIENMPNEDPKKKG